MLHNISELSEAGTSATPALVKLVREFTEIVHSPRFPCTFAPLPFIKQELYFSLIGDGGAPIEEAAVGELRQLCGIIRQVPDAIGVIFVDRFTEGSMTDDFALASKIVRATMRANALDHPGVTFPQPHESHWELWLDDVGLFLNFSTPRHKARRSRNVGSAFTIIAQARESFDRQGRATPRARNAIRERLGTYDDVPPHPCLGSYDDPESREALQFFLGDGMTPMDPTEALPDEQ
ncbi:YqcI/YcgG family protein [[Actinomadura] parvosata]|uniref:YqcI/YcgG family protein n=1 Tax=[Actinomadura] parvosata TaxID=1955412 RepID=UPI00406C87B0